MFLFLFPSRVFQSAKKFGTKRLSTQITSIFQNLSHNFPERPADAEVGEQHLALLLEDGFAVLVAEDFSLHNNSI